MSKNVFLEQILEEVEVEKKIENFIKYNGLNDIIIKIPNIKIFDKNFMNIIFTKYNDTYQIVQLIDEDVLPYSYYVNVNYEVYDKKRLLLEIGVGTPRNEVLFLLKKILKYLETLNIKDINKLKANSKASEFNI